MRNFLVAFTLINLLLLIFFIRWGAASWEYEVRNIQGWEVKISRQLWVEEREVTRQAIALLDIKLNKVKSVVPAKHHDFLTSVIIWVEKDTPGFSGMVYHLSAKWLEEHGYNPNKARAIEIAKINSFIDRTATQPWHVLHELAHAYHHQVIGKDFVPIIEAYDLAVSQGLYRQVPRNTGSIVNAYALNSYSEYFAELTEAYFGENDFFPFTKQELIQYDPIGYQAIEQAWEIE
ncbi:MAG: hypothetical protein AAFR62_18295 [Cyanobacteria bacterium J06629_2]